MQCDVCTTTEQYPSANPARQYGLRRMHSGCREHILSKKKIDSGTHVFHLDL